MPCFPHPSTIDSRSKSLAVIFSQAQVYQHANPVGHYSILDPLLHPRCHRSGPVFPVVVWDYDRAVAEKRSGQSASVFDHLQPPGFSRESFAGRKAKPLDAERIAKIKDFIEKARVALGIPGVAIGLYQDGKVVFE